MKKILLGIYLAVMAVFCLLFDGDLLYVAIGLALISVLVVLNGFTEKAENRHNQNE